MRGFYSWSDGYVGDWSFKKGREEQGLVLV